MHHIRFIHRHNQTLPSCVTGNDTVLPVEGSMVVLSVIRFFGRAASSTCMAVVEEMCSNDLLHVGARLTFSIILE